MMLEVRVEEMKGPTPDELDVEIVERKGLGHPDTICDLGPVSSELSRMPDFCAELAQGNMRFADKQGGET